MTRKKISTLVLLAVIIFGTFPMVLQAQTKKALLIGIDIYKPANQEVSESRGGNWTNLDGCVNDAVTIKEIITTRFGFDEKNITSVFDQDAKRERIISEFEKLIDGAEKGDVIFIYYAGHGSQVNNSLSAEVAGDKKDESIVPADLLDIRDKELAALFNRLLDKEVILTLIFDSCHSGSIARGNNLPDVAKTRFLPGTNLDAKDPSDPAKPEDRGALIISAAQPEQLAKEALDDQGNPHGAFTVALLKALASSPTNESAEVIFLRIKAIMQANGSNQEPVLGGNEARRKQGLFGENVSEGSGKTMVAVLKVNGAEDIQLQGGWAVGLNAKCELKKSGSNNPLERILITEISGLSKCKAKILEGDISNIKPGDIFEVVVWATAENPNLRVWFPTNNFSYADIQKTAVNIGGLANNKSYIWITDPTKETPTHIIQYFDNKWIMTCPQNKTEDLGNNPTAESIAKKLPKAAKVYLQLPPPESLVAALKIGAGSENNAIEITNDPLRANYILVGSFAGGIISYAWIRPNTTVNDTAFQTTLPLRTDWLEAKQETDFVGTGEKLTEFALKLGKINAWLNLSSPPDDGTYPFSLALKNLSSGEYITTGTVYDGERYGVVMITDQTKLKLWMGKSRYVYVFTIDVAGKTQQVFPSQNTGNEGNKLPNKTYQYENEISLGQISFTIGEPFGVDSWFIISSDEPINNFQAFNTEGVVTASGTRGGSGLDGLLNGVGAGTRGITTNTTPANWSIQKLAVTSKAK